MLCLLGSESPTVACLASVFDILQELVLSGSNLALSYEGYVYPIE